MPLGFLARVLQNSKVRRFFRARKQNTGVMFKHELPRPTSIIAVVSKGSTAVLLRGTGAQTWIRLSGWDLQLRGGGMADDLATIIGPAQFGGGGATPVARWGRRSG